MPHASWERQEDGGLGTELPECPKAIRLSMTS
jgi:hypothetical protein